MLWPFFEGNQRSIKCIAAYIESFPYCGEPAGYKLESQRCYKVIFQVQGHVSRAKHGFIPHCRYIKWRPETHFISAKDVHFIVSYTWGMIFLFCEISCATITIERLNIHHLSSRMDLQRTFAMKWKVLHCGKCVLWWDIFLQVANLSP